MISAPSSRGALSLSFYALQPRRDYPRAQLDIGGALEVATRNLADGAPDWIKERIAQSKERRMKLIGSDVSAGNGADAGPDKAS